MRDFDIIHSEIYEFKSFDFWDKDSRIQLCYESALERLKAIYPDKFIDSCDYFGLYVFDDNDNLLTQYTTGHTDEETLAIRDENTKEIVTL